MPFAYLRDKLKSGFKTEGWNGKRITSWKVWAWPQQEGLSVLSMSVLWKYWSSIRIVTIDFLELLCVTSVKKYPLTPTLIPVLVPPPHLPPSNLSHETLCWVVIATDALCICFILNGYVLTILNVLTYLSICKALCVTWSNRTHKKSVC